MRKTVGLTLLTLIHLKDGAGVELQAEGQDQAVFGASVAEANVRADTRFVPIWCMTDVSRCRLLVRTTKCRGRRRKTPQSRQPDDHLPSKFFSTVLRWPSIAVFAPSGSRWNSASKIA
jgi:hypothetical protein